MSVQAKTNPTVTSNGGQFRVTCVIRIALLSKDGKQKVTLEFKTV